MNHSIYFKANILIWIPAQIAAGIDVGIYYYLPFQYYVWISCIICVYILGIQSSTRIFHYICINVPASSSTEQLLNDIYIYIYISLIVYGFNLNCLFLKSRPDVNMFYLASSLWNMFTKSHNHMAFQCRMVLYTLGQPRPKLSLRPSDAHMRR